MRILKDKIILIQIILSLTAIISCIFIQTHSLSAENNDIYIVNSSLNKYYAPNIDVVSTELDFLSKVSVNYKYINSNNVKIFSEPDDESEILDILKIGDFVSILSSESSDTLGWVLIDHAGLQGYIYKDFTTNEFVYRYNYGPIYVREDTYAYAQPYLTEQDKVKIKFNQQLLQVYSNEQWSICNINDEAYFIPRNMVSSTINFIDTNKILYVKQNNVPLYTTPDLYFPSNLVFLYDDVVNVVQENENWSAINVDNEIYYIQSKYLNTYKDLDESECGDKEFNKKYDNTYVINRLNTYYSKEIAEEFALYNPDLAKTINEYLESASITAGENASPGEIVYYCYLDLMDNSRYSYNTYGSQVKKKYGIYDNTGSYRAAAILDRTISKGACENYAAAMTLFLRIMGFDAEIVGGNGGGSGSNGHYWCQVGDLVFDAQIDDSRNEQGLRFGRTSDELVAMGHSGYYVEQTKTNDSTVKRYNEFLT